MKKQRNYDRKVKNTRILLSDYLLLKGYSQDAGVSMAEALHTIITRDWAMAKRKARAVAEPVAVATKPAFRVTAPVSIATNGSKVATFRIKQGVTKYE